MSTRNNHKTLLDEMDFVPVGQQTLLVTDVEFSDLNQKISIHHKYPSVIPPSGGSLIGGNRALFFTVNLPD